MHSLIKGRETSLASFGEKNIPVGAPMASLESVLVPLYLAHRYQADDVAKSLGGVNYTYAMRGDGQVANTPVAPQAQREALKALLETLNPAFLALPERLIALIPPQPLGYGRDREMFQINTGMTFDPLAAAESSAANTLSLIFNPMRLARVLEQHARNSQYPSVMEVFDQVFDPFQNAKDLSGFQQEISRLSEKAALQHLLQLAGDREIQQQVSALALQKIRQLDSVYERLLYKTDSSQEAHYRYLLEQIRLFRDNPGQYKVPPMPALPDGAPIGCSEDWH